MKTYEKRRSGRAASLLSSLLLAAAVLICAAVVFQVRTAGYVSVFGRSLFRVVTGSMEPTVPIGSLLLSRKTDIDEIEVGDIICYRSEDDATNGWVITHRVVRVFTKDGETCLETKGDANTSSDDGFVTRDNLIGRVTWYSERGSFAAKAVSALTSKAGLMTLILLPCLLFAGVAMSRAVKSLRREINDLKSESRTAEEKPQAPSAGISPGEYAEMRERILRELAAERETMLRELSLRLSEELQQGETHEDQETQAAPEPDGDGEPTERSA